MFTPILLGQLTFLLAASALAHPQPTYGAPSSSATPGGGPDADGKYLISAEGIEAYFIPYGASISNLFVPDRGGAMRDVVLGFDNASYYSIDEAHPHLGGVPGRYANRIKNASFEIDGEVYHVDANENDGLDTLHGGSNGWDWRNWTVVAHTPDSITFSLVDPDGEMGFPGEVVSYVTYSVSPHTWHIRMTALATTKKTPIMLTSHTYWNLDAFQNPSTPTALNHTLHLPYSGQRLAVDGILIPTGPVLPNEPGSVNDFWSAPKHVGANFSSPELLGNCGAGCTGYDNCFLLDRFGAGVGGAGAGFDWREKGPVAEVASADSGIRLGLWTDQRAFQVYSCGGQNGTLPIKETQGFFDDDSRPRVVPQYGCLVLEVQDYIDGINNPAWGRKQAQIYGPGDDPHVVEAMYVFSVDE
ncbi:aldose 1-epimerase [Lineolata rhizophorae]|uniref:Aldose 1-epimerase n=1 Tax=Lineolata rhizophorae TaxID=578093 RepID=A0A6A6P3P4_9PEZI|nr:aldose 1-epimerase [Lineolata rhizophorae]